jgi:hypothetical protein
MRSHIGRTAARLSSLGLLAMLAAAQQHRLETQASVVVPKNPYLSNNGQIPPKSQYNGPLFKLSHDWPAEAAGPVNDAPWRRAMGNKQISPKNANAYVLALKQYVSADARKLFLDPNFDAAAAKWYNEPWLGSLREAIHGTYPAGQFGPSIFPGTGLKTTFDTHVLTYYLDRAAYPLTKVWSRSALKPAIGTANFQFPEGSVVVKAAVFVSDDPKIQTNWWPVTNGAAKWPLYLSIPSSASPQNPPQVINGYVMQFDIIVKDTAAAPKTGWVFATLVYDVNAPGKDAWDKMVPLGAMWGNDPNVNSSAPNPPPLTENWINPKAPKYSTQTLGWGGRLSGPNDGATNDIQVGNQVIKNAPNSSCMSCHGPAEWQPKEHQMISFLLPSYPNATPPPPFKACGPNGEYICSPAPGSTDWMRWFQSRPGTEPQDPNTGSAACDYDMVFAFKTLPMWWKAMSPAGTPAPFSERLLQHGALPAKVFNEYSGAPLKKQP